MKFLFTSYVTSPEFHGPLAWLERIKGYVGILEQLATQHEVISIERINYTGRLQLSGVNYQFINFKKRKIPFPWKTHSLIKKANPDVVVVHGLHFPLQVIQLRMALGKRATIIVQHHAEKPAVGFRKHLQQLADRQIDAYLFAASEMGMDWVRKGNINDARKVHEVMEASSFFEPIDKAKARSITDAEGSLIFLWVGRLDHNKDPLTVVSAFLQFVRLSPQAKLYMIYHTTELLDEIKKLVAKSGLSNNVVFVGKIDHNDMAWWFNSVDFIISGSHYEGSGVAVCEAMSCGCVPILTDIPSFRKMTRDGTCGLLYKPGDSDALLQMLCQASELDYDEAQWKVLNQFQNELSFKAIARHIEEVVTICKRQTT